MSPALPSHDFLSGQSRNKRLGTNELLPSSLQLLKIIAEHDGVYLTEIVTLLLPAMSIQSEH